MGSEMCIRDRHDQEFTELRDKQRREEERALAHMPVDLLNLRKKLDSLAAAGEYLKSKKVEARLNDAEVTWKNAQLEKFDQKWADQLDRLKQRHVREGKSLHDKWDK